jgi:long-chain acyl-CoA synthetase
VNLVETLLATAASDPQQPALVGPEPLTYGELAARAALTASAVRERAQAGDRVAIVAGNEAAFVVAYLATLLAGAVAVPLNVGSPSHEIARELDAVGPALVLASEANADLARRAVSQPAVSQPAARTEESSEESSQRSIPVLVVGGETPRNSPAEPAVAPTTAAPKNPDDLAVLLFTAGTAGAPKPAMLTHGSLLANIEQMQSHPGLRVDPSDVVLGVLPLFHVYGLNVVIGLALRAGAAVALVDHFHPVETLARVRSDGVTVLAGVPAIFDAWVGLAEETAPRDSLAEVRLCVSGATTLLDGTRAAMRDRFGVTVHDGYGLTEASPVVTTTAVATVPRPGSIGPPLPGIEVRLVDGDGNPVLEDDPGQIVVRGDNVFAGYWNDASATAAVLVDGWLQTGDVAVADADGWLTLVDRAKDVVIVSGFNVYPGEVEDALRSHRDVEDVAVIGQPHPRTGETVVAYVVARPGSHPDPVELLRHAGRQLARYKLPTRVELVESLPRTLAGKLVRRELSSSPTSSSGAASAPAASAAPGRPADDATTNPK